MEYQESGKSPLRYQIESMLQRATVEKMRLEAGQALARLTSAMHRQEDSLIDDSIINNGFVVDFSEWKHGVDADQQLLPHAPPELPATITTTPNSIRHMHLGVHSEESIELQGMHVWERSSSSGGAGAPVLGAGRSSSRARTRRAQQRKQRMLDTLLLRNSQTIHRQGPASAGADTARSRHRAKSTTAPARVVDVEGLARSYGYLNLEGYKKSSLAAARRFMRAGAAAHEAREAILAQEESRVRKLKRKLRKQRGSKAMRKAIREAGKTVRKVQKQRPRSALPQSSGGMGRSAGAAASSPARSRAAKPNPRPVSSQGTRSIARYPRLQTLPSHTPRLDMRGLGGAGAMQKVHAFVRGAACVYEEARVSTRRGLLARAAMGARRVRRMEHQQEIDEMQVPMGARLRLPDGVRKRRKRRKRKTSKNKTRKQHDGEDWVDTGSGDQVEYHGEWYHAKAMNQHEMHGPHATQTSPSSAEWSGDEEDEYDESSLQSDATSTNDDEHPSTPGFHPTPAGIVIPRLPPHERARPRSPSSGSATSPHAGAGGRASPGSPTRFPRLMGAIYGIEEEAEEEAGEVGDRESDGTGSRDGGGSSSRGSVNSSTSSMDGAYEDYTAQGHHGDGGYAQGSGGESGAFASSNGNGSDSENSETESTHGGAAGIQHSPRANGASIAPSDSNGDFFTVPGAGPAIQPHLPPYPVNPLTIGSMGTRSHSYCAEAAAGAARSRPKSALASGSSSRQQVRHSSPNARRRMSVTFEPGLSQLSRDTSQPLDRGSIREDSRGRQYTRRRKGRRRRARRASLSLSPPSRGSPAVSTAGSSGRGTQPEGPGTGHSGHDGGRRGSRDWRAPLHGDAGDAGVLQPRPRVGTSRSMHPAEAALRARGRPGNSSPGMKGSGGRKSQRMIARARGSISHRPGRQGSNGSPQPRPRRPAVGIQGEDVELLRISKPTFG